MDPVDSILKVQFQMFHPSFFWGGYPNIIRVLYIWFYNFWKLYLLDLSLQHHGGLEVIVTYIYIYSWVYYKKKKQ